MSVTRLLLSICSGFVLAGLLGCDSEADPEVLDLRAANDMEPLTAQDLLTTSDIDEELWMTDTIDGGDDPFAPGCWNFYKDDQCSDHRWDWGSGDVCVDATVIKEMTAPTVCTPVAGNEKMVISKYHDCNELCQKQQSVPGYCATVPNFCQNNGVNTDWDNSAMCVCDTSPLNHTDIDGGNAPFKPGCHYSWTDNVCREGQTLIGGDLCDADSPTIIHEWTHEDACHEGGEARTPLDCNELCKQTRGKGWFGYCEPVADACDGKGSAKCECILEL